MELLSLLKISESIGNLLKKCGQKIYVKKIYNEGGQRKKYIENIEQVPERNFEEIYPNYFKTFIAIFNKTEYNYGSLECKISNIKIQNYKYSDIKHTFLETLKDNSVEYIYKYSYNNGNGYGKVKYNFEIYYGIDTKKENLVKLEYIEREMILRGGEIQLVFKIDLKSYRKQIPLDKGVIYVNLEDNQNTGGEYYLFDKNVIYRPQRGAAAGYPKSQIVVDLTRNNLSDKVYPIEMNFPSKTEKKFFVDFLIDKTCKIRYRIDIFDSTNKNIGGQDMEINVQMPKYKSYNSISKLTLAQYIYQQGCVNEMDKLTYQIMEENCKEIIYTIEDTKREIGIL